MDLSKIRKFHYRIRHCARTKIDKIKTLTPSGEKHNLETDYMKNIYQAKYVAKSLKKILGLFVVALVISSCTINVGQDRPSTNNTSLNQDIKNNLNGVAPESGLLDIESQGRIYLEIVNSVNCLMRRISLTEEENMIAENQVDPIYFDELRRLFASLAEARSVASTQLQRHDWPESIKNEIDTMANSWALVSQLELEIAEANTIDSYNTAYYNWLYNDLPSNPQFIRSQLGVGSADITDRC